MAEIKNVKKGDMVILRAFTGMPIGKKVVSAADAKTITIELGDGDKRKFSKKTGVQIEPAAKAERFANYITEDDGSYEKEMEERAKRKAAKKAEKATKKSKKPAEPVEPEEDDEVEKEPETKKPTKKTSKKSKPEPEPEEDDEEDDDDDDYEEVE